MQEKRQGLEVTLNFRRKVYHVSTLELHMQTCGSLFFSQPFHEANTKHVNDMVKFHLSVEVGRGYIKTPDKNT